MLDFCLIIFPCVEDGNEILKIPKIIQYLNYLAIYWHQFKFDVRKEKNY